ncbi:MAG: DNA-binding MarR family transcriptional regulator [Granulosicoccus sp.]|jgi:DNA-binding MarR family transcriptional regulator
MPRAAKKLDFTDVSDLVAILGAVGAQAKKEPLTKPQVVELTGVPTPRVTAAYKRLLKMELTTQIAAPADMPQKGIYLKIAVKGKAYAKAYNLLFA